MKTLPNYLYPKYLSSLNAFLIYFKANFKNLYLSQSQNENEKSTGDIYSKAEVCTDPMRLSSLTKISGIAPESFEHLEPCRSGNAKSSKSVSILACLIKNVVSSPLGPTKLTGST